MQIKNTVRLAIFAFSTLFANSAEPDTELQIIQKLSSALHAGSVTEFLAAATTGCLPMPRIPDKWHVENMMSDPNEIEIANAGRDFGILLAKELENIAVLIQRLPPDDRLFSLSMTLCGLTEWCAQAEGIGNLLLAGRCIDLASVGLARLTANIDFPLASCESLEKSVRDVSRLVSLPKCAKILDREANAALFTSCKTEDEMLRVWLAGGRRNMREKFSELKAGGREVPDGVFFEDPITSSSMLDARASFFTNYSSSNPMTCLNQLIAGRNHGKIVVGIYFRSTEKALALLKFRKLVGYYPEKWVRSEEEKIAMEKEILESAKWGIKVNPIENDPSFNPLRFAFEKAWREKNTNLNDSPVYSTAVEAYEEIQSNCFFDSDTQAINQKAQSDAWLKTQLESFNGGNKDK